MLTAGQRSSPSFCGRPEPPSSKATLREASAAARDPAPHGPSPPRSACGAVTKAARHPPEQEASRPGRQGWPRLPAGTHGEEVGKVPVQDQCVQKTISCFLCRTSPSSQRFLASERLLLQSSHCCRAWLYVRAPREESLVG